MGLKTQMQAEAIDEDRLSRVKFDPTEVGIHPGDPVDLGELPGTHLEGPRDEGGRVEVGLHRPRPHDLS